MGIHGIAVIRFGEISGLKDARVRNKSQNASEFFVDVLKVRHFTRKRFIAECLVVEAREVVFEEGL